MTGHFFQSMSYASKTAQSLSDAGGADPVDPGHGSRAQYIFKIMPAPQPQLIQRQQFQALPWPLHSNRVCGHENPFRGWDQF